MARRESIRRINSQTQPNPTQQIERERAQSDQHDRRRRTPSFNRLIGTHSYRLHASRCVCVCACSLFLSSPRSASSSLVSLRSRESQLTQFTREYTQLLGRITTLSTRVRHELMIPLGRLAFQPGYLHHTNELTVLLGDNFFVERSTHQASELIRRRQEYLKQQLKYVREQMENIIQVEKRSKQLFGTPTGEGEEDVEGGLGVSFKDGVMRNEEGEEVIEIKEEYVEEEEIEEKTQSATASPPASSSSQPASSTDSSAPAGSASTLNFPSFTDKNFDDFWSELEDMEKEQEAAEAEAARAGMTAPATSASATATVEEVSEEEEEKSPAESSLDDIMPVPSPTLRPIANPADIFRHMTQAKIKSGELPPPTPLPKPLTTSAPAAAKPVPTPTDKSSSSPLTSAAIDTSRSLDAAFASYKQSRRSGGASGGKRVSFADDSDEEVDKGAPLTQDGKIKPAISAAKAKTKPIQSHASASSSSGPKPLPPKKTKVSTADAFTGEILERGSTPIVARTPLPPAPSAARTIPPNGPRPIGPPLASMRTTGSAYASGGAAHNDNAPQPKMSRFKAKMLGLAYEDDD